MHFSNAIELAHKTTLKKSHLVTIGKTYYIVSYYSIRITSPLSVLLTGKEMLNIPDTTCVYLIP